MPTRELVELGHAHGLPVYPSISVSGMRARHSSIAAWYGAAANARHAGADGLYLFNHFPSQANDPKFSTLGDADAIGGYDKMFAIDNRSILEGDLRQAITQSQILPISLDPAGKARQVNLPVGDNIAAAAEAGRIKDATLRVQFAPPAAPTAVQLRLNGLVIKPASGADKDGWVTYQSKPSQYRHGDNKLTFRITTSDGKPISVQAVELHVDYKE